MPEVSKYAAKEALRDGGPVTIRAIRPDDKERLLHHFQNLSPLSVHYRFMGGKRSLSEADLHHLTELDFVDHVGLAATVGRDSDEHFIGVGRYIRAHHAQAEVAFAVLDEYHGHGIGTLLLHHLARIARDNGVKTFTAVVMGANKQMLEVFANSGLPYRDSNDAGIVHVHLDLEPKPDQQ